MKMILFSLRKNDDIQSDYETGQFHIKTSQVQLSFKKTTSQDTKSYLVEFLIVLKLEWIVKVYTEMR